MPLRFDDYYNPPSPHEFVEQMLARMTTEEKAAKFEAVCKALVAHYGTSQSNLADEMHSATGIPADMFK